MRTGFRLAAVFGLSAVLTTPAAAFQDFTDFSFSTGNPDGLVGTASRPSAAGLFEIESADDFILSSNTLVNGASFTGLLPSSTNVNQVVVEIYRVFPNDSDVGRTSGPPTFSTSQVPTRVNSPSDVAFDSRDSASNGLSFTTTSLNPSFTVLNSVQPGGIHPKPDQATLGNGPVTGNEVRFDVTFAHPFDLPANHYFFVPQVGLSDGTFLWLSAPKPIVAPGTPFLGDLQSWTRDAQLDPDWLRVGTDIITGATFNAAFSLTGTVPEPSSAVMFGLGSLLVAGCAWRRSSRP
jgi:hypothetical protein